jgi:hypothetical protein
LMMPANIELFGGVHGTTEGQTPGLYQSRLNKYRYRARTDTGKCNKMHKTGTRNPWVAALEVDERVQTNAGRE